MSLSTFDLAARLLRCLGTGLLGIIWWRSSFVAVLEVEVEVGMHCVDLSVLIGTKPNMEGDTNK